ncbi:ReoY family proteolytic degradation factor [Lentibacillus sp. N15]|uniref:ReoY family proteolytic degradation factor n=1 Tax=Lentibacillus songyuanensis TaxID=3136161 RepID=UPI0031BB4E75
MIETADKKVFLKWFLDNHTLKIRQSVWILNYILNHQELLSNVHFVQDVRFCPRGIFISTTNSKELPFKYFDGNTIHTNAEKVFDDLRSDHGQPLYIELNFKNVNQTIEYINVLEENPFIPLDYHIGEKESKLAEQFLIQSILQKQKVDIKQLIDQALDNHDKDRFYQLSKELLYLEENSKGKVPFKWCKSERFNERFNERIT